VVVVTVGRQTAQLLKDTVGEKAVVCQVFALAQLVKELIHMSTRLRRILTHRSLHNVATVTSAVDLLDRAKEVCCSASS